MIVIFLCDFFCLTAQHVPPGPGAYVLLTAVPTIVLTSARFALVTWRTLQTDSASGFCCGCAHLLRENRSIDRRRTTREDGNEGNVLGKRHHFLFLNLKTNR
jgi:hypothetical protein